MTSLIAYVGLLNGMDLLWVSLMVSWRERKQLEICNEGLADAGKRECEGRGFKSQCQQVIFSRELSREKSVIRKIYLDFVP